VTSKFIFGECDCCGERNRVLNLCVAHGVDTAACTDCQGRDEAEDADEIEFEIERLTPKAETGEQWAHICALEAEQARLRSVWSDVNGQFGVGA
jgi:hypothetical protein